MVVTYSLTGVMASTDSGWTSSPLACSRASEFPGVYKSSCSTEGRGLGLGGSLTHGDDVTRVHGRTYSFVQCAFYWSR
jgi:hypothetical protein